MAAKSVTLSDVAAVAGVSVSTASKVLNGGGRASAETRARIREAADRLDFRPNALAQFFATGRSFTVGILTEDAQSIFTRSILLGAVIALGKHDMAALLYDAHKDDAALEDSLRILQARRIDGLLVMGDELGTPARSVSSRFSSQVAYIRSPSENPGDVSFLSDSVMAGRIATQHLVDIGRTRIAHITNFDSISARQREAGLMEVLVESGLTLAAGRHIDTDWTRSGGEAATRQLLATGSTFDAVFCSNDQQALGAYDALTAAGVSVPDDVALIGVDNFEALAGLRERLLTTVDLNHRALGTAAVEYLVGDDADLRGVQLQDCTLVLGRSTLGDAAPPALVTLEAG